VSCLGYSVARGEAHEARLLSGQQNVALPTRKGIEAVQHHALRPAYSNTFYFEDTPTTYMQLYHRNGTQSMHGLLN
jgi:hypothetical protein